MPEQATLVQDSLRLIVPIKDQAAGLFCGRPFAPDPGPKARFTGTDMVEQGAKPMAPIGFAAAGLQRPAEAVPAAQAPAKRHVGDGDGRRPYAKVGAALLGTLGQGLGNAFTPKVGATWTAAHTLLAGVMIAAAAEGWPSVGGGRSWVVAAGQPRKPASMKRTSRKARKAPPCSR